MLNFFRYQSLGLLGAVAGIFLLVANAVVAAGPEAVAVVRAVEWSRGDAAREGAAELVVLMEIARVRQSAAPAGLIGVGDRRGLFNAGAEEALYAAACDGFPVVKLARDGKVLPAPHGLFLDGGTLTEVEASRVLAQCLARFGPLPKLSVGDVSKAARTRERQLREALRDFQRELTLANSLRTASR